MSRPDFVPPVVRVDNRDVDPLGTFDDGTGPKFRLNFEPEERELLIRLLGEMKDLLTAEVTEVTAPLLHRLFPPAFRDDPEKEAEYQRLMREELVTSRVVSVELVTAMLTADPDTGRLTDLSKPDTMAFMQSLNAVRLVLGTMLDITDDDSAEQADMDDSHEFQLYGYLGWLLEWTVQSLSETA
jgi:hypothetical protein